MNTFTDLINKQTTQLRVNNLDLSDMFRPSSSLPKKRKETTAQEQFSTYNIKLVALKPSLTPNLDVVNELELYQYPITNLDCLEVVDADIPVFTCLTIKIANVALKRPWTKGRPYVSLDPKIVHTIGLEKDELLYLSNGEAYMEVDWRPLKPILITPTKDKVRRFNLSQDNIMGGELIIDCQHNPTVEQEILAVPPSMWFFFLQLNLHKNENV